MLLHSSIITVAWFCSAGWVSAGHRTPTLLYTINLQENEENAHLITPKNNIFNKSVDFAIQLVDRMERLETNIGYANKHIIGGSASHGQLINSKPEAETLKQGRSALIAAKATSQLMYKYCPEHHLSQQDCINEVSKFSLLSTLLSESCPKPKLCTPNEINSPYSSADGSCNSNYEEISGKSFTGYKRLLPANYVDGIHEPQTRSVSSKRNLPSPRLISTTLRSMKLEENDATLAVMQWGQFIEHDMAFTATSKMVHSEKTIECCDTDGYNLSPRHRHPFCLQIRIPDNDHFYSDHMVTCMPYVRSVIAMKSDCTFGPADQINQATHYLDGSQIYGAGQKKADSLRKFEKGLMKFKHIIGLEYLPQSNNPVGDCQYINETCAVSGDHRANFLPPLTAMHTLWLREHNRIAVELSRINEHWNDETIYQEARKIVISEIQHITYNEWLPAILGSTLAFKLQQSSYAAHEDSRVSNSFATVGLKFIYSLVDDILNLYNENRKVYTTLNVKDHFNKPNIVEEHNHFDGLIRGLATQHSQSLDLYYADGVHTYLYKNGNYGYDILSLDIQRGRDHGIPTYTSMRKFCGLPSIAEFSELSDLMPSETISLLKQLYDSPEDIDLLVGGMAEKSEGDSLLGPTLSCIVADQFERTKSGDRYFYDNLQQPKPFTEAQRAEIEKSSLARIFCDNGNAIEFMQPNVFNHLKESNRLSSCIGKELGYVDLKAWKETNL